jgi:hypothetical protein
VAVTGVVLSDDVIEDRRHIVSEIENALEHLVIVPRSASYGFEPYDYWNTVTAKAWNNYPWPSVQKSMGRRLTCFLGWLIRDLLNDSATISHMKRSLLAEGLLTEAEELRLSVCNQLSAKGSNAALVLKAIGVPPNDVVLMSVEFPSGQAEYSPIPSI